jgi:hypothetical protein
MAVALNMLTVYEGVDLGPRQLGKYTKAAHQEIGYRWQIDMLPRHFTSAARSIYRHKPRSRKYEQRKRQLAGRGLVQEGGNVDLVFTGLTKRLMRQRHQVQAFPSRVTIKMLGPSYLRMRPNKSNQPDKAKEITTVTAEEEKKLTAIGSETFHRAMLKSRVVRRKLIKAGHSV